MAETPTEVFTRRMAYYRRRRDWSQERLAAELTQVGWSIHRVQVAKIEAGKRGVSLDEAVTIAWALGLPPALLWLPLGEADNVALAPDVEVHPDLARKWVIGAEPATDSSQFAHMFGKWKSDMAVWWFHDELYKATEAAHEARAELASAEYVGNTARIEEARAPYFERLKAVADVLKEMREREWVVPALHYRTVADMHAAGIEYDGPTYDPKERE